jgi:hypothetical protein
MTERPEFGMIGVFASPDRMVESARQLRALGLEAVDSFTPFQVEEMDALSRPRGRWLLPTAIGAGALAGACIGYLVQYWDEAWGYPLNVGGRPYNSWPAFTVGAFEMTLLCAVAAGFFGLLLACGLPRLYHPIFAASGFERVSSDRYVLCVAARDPKFEADAVRDVFERHGAEHVAEVPI